ncbi:MAG: PAS domain-containing protein [Proteobacteria bacterium]|nr:PAS domain-containing protein [Pseudomonadota bacterium]
MTEQILIIDDDIEHAQALGTYLERLQYEVSIAAATKEVLPMLDTSWDIILGNPFISDQITDRVEQVAQASLMTQVIIYVKPEVLDQAMERFGLKALDYLSLPINSKALELSLERARKNAFQIRKNNRYVERLGDLHDAQILLNQLFDVVPCYISVQDKNLRITAINKRFKEDFGNYIGGHCYRIYKHRKTPCEKCPVVQTFEDGKIHSTEEVVTSVSGKQYNVLTHTAPIKNAKGEITQVMEMSTNITQIRQLQDHLTSLGLMLGSMSHGVKGMLTALDGGIYQLETGLNQKDEPRISKAFGQVKMMTDKIKKMVLEILYYAKSRELQYVTKNVSDLVKNIVANVQPLALKNNVTLNIRIAKNPGKIEIDPSWLEAALVNFLENAVDACAFDRNKPEHIVEFVVEKPDTSRLWFKISDNGIGMDQETREKMFTLFFTSKGSQGTGLGLFIAHRVIQQHGGFVKVESEQDKGTLFTINLPRKRPEKIKTIVAGE